MEALLQEDEDVSMADFCLDGKVYQHQGQAESG